jgi:tRNA-specific 2-thiouridylase
MTQDELLRTEFPLGDLKKEKTRDIALRLGLKNALRPESQEICFVGEGSYGDFIRGIATDACKPGPIITLDGKEVGSHRGIAFYTIGQRKRLEIQSLRPYYVVDINVKENVIVVGSKIDVMKERFKVKELNWISIGSLREPMRAAVKIRSTMEEKGATVIPVENQMVRVELDEPQWAPASGQSAVFYHDDVVVGGGVIE